MDAKWWWVIGGVAVAGFALWMWNRSRQQQQSNLAGGTAAVQDPSPLGDALRGLGLSGEASGLVTGSLAGIV